VPEREEREGGRGSILQPLLVTVLVLALLLGFAWLPRLFRVATMVDKDAPNFSVPILAEGSAMKTGAPHAEGTSPKVALQDFRGKAVVIDFWATWCGPCMMELPVVEGVARRMANKNVMVLAVNTDDAQESAEEWITARSRKGDRTPLAMPIAFDDTNAAGRAYDVHNLPTLVVVSKTGKIVAVRVGVTEASELERLIEKAL